MTNKAKTLSKENGREFLQQSFASVQRVLETQLRCSQNSITHNLVMGEVNEQHFVTILRSYLPKRYEVDSGIVIDSRGKTSHHIDIIIFDPQYTPTLMAEKNHRYVPIEAVYAVFEVKPCINREYLDYAADKAASVRELEPTSIPIPHAGGVFDAKPPINIVSGILAIDIEWKKGLAKNFESKYKQLQKKRRLDCGLAVSGYCFDNFDSSLMIKQKEDKALIFFIFRLLEKLQSLGTVPAIDWNAYAQQLSS